MFDLCLIFYEDIAWQVKLNLCNYSYFPNSSARSMAKLNFSLYIKYNKNNEVIKIIPDLPQHMCHSYTKHASIFNTTKLNVAMPTCSWSAPKLEFLNCNDIAVSQ